MLKANPLVQSSKLEQWCVKHSLILLEALQSWRADNPNTMFESLVVKNYQALNEERWLEQAAFIPNGPTPMPIPDSCAIPEGAITHQSERLRRDLFSIILQDDPVMVVGVLNPFETAPIVSYLSNYFPGVPYAIVAITPHAYVKLAGLAERAAASAISPAEEEDLVQWANSLNFDAATFVDTRALIEDLWTGNPPYPVLPPHQYDISMPLPDISEALLIQKTATHAWVVSPKAADQMLNDKLYQALSRKIIMMTIGPKEFARIQDSLKMTKIEGVKVEENEPLVVRDWGVPNTIMHPEVILFEKILESAIKMGASDIHFEPKTELTIVRFRIDGELITQAPIPKVQYSLLARRAKIIGGMRHEKTGIMQDGAGYHELNAVRWDMRYSVCVAKGGEESMVIRIFGSKLPRLEDLGLPLREMTTLQWYLDQESGMFVSTGPTGSGKTTTLYACLKALDNTTRKLMTIEHPVEKHFENAVQVDVRDADADDPNTITFRMALRAALRHDPDVIMVGEMRDMDSAQIAVQAALTGHLVLTTVHANDAVGVIERMCGSFNLDRIALGYALKLAVAQRLVSKLCPHCRRTRPADPEDLRPFPEANIPEPVISERVGCPACRGSGCIGRRVIMEMLPVDSEITALIEQHALPSDIRHHNNKRGYTNLVFQATLLLLRGEIELDEARTFLTKPVF
ncbi:MAG: GspE/PulE family protein [Verrucomicrobiota bacterium]